MPFQIIGYAQRALKFPLTVKFHLFRYTPTCSNVFIEKSEKRKPKTKIKKIK